METHKEYVLEVFSDQNYVRDIVKGILHTIFFHRYFPSVRPSLWTPSSSSRSRSDEALHVALPAILDPPEISATIDAYTAQLVSQLTSPSSSSSTSPGIVSSRGEIAIQFLDRKRRKTGIAAGWLGRLGGGGGGGAQMDEEICWEQWVLRVSVARPKSETDRIKAHGAMESSVTKAAMKIVSIVSSDKDHIPPILTSDQNPFPYKIFVNPQ